MNWSNFAKIGIQVASAVVPQIGLIESVAKAIPTLKGQEKETAVLTLSQSALEAVEGAAGKELVGDPQFDDAVRQFVRSYVALQNAIVSAKATHAAQAVVEQSTAAILEVKQ